MHEKQGRQLCLKHRVTGYVCSKGLPVMCEVQGHQLCVKYRVASYV